MRRRGAGRAVNECEPRLMAMEIEIVEAVKARPDWWLARDSLRRVRNYLAEAVPWEPSSVVQELAVRSVERNLAAVRGALIVDEAARIVDESPPSPETVL